MSHLVTLPNALGERSLQRVVSISEALFFTPGDPVPTQRLAHLSLDVADFLSRAGRQTRYVICLSLWLVSLAVPLFARRFTGLTRLSIEERVTALSKLENSALGAPLLAVKALLCLLYYEDPDAARAIGFDGSCLKRTGFHDTDSENARSPSSRSDEPERAESQDAHRIRAQRR